MGLAVGLRLQTRHREEEMCVCQSIQAFIAVFSDLKLEAQIWMKLQDSISWYSRHESTLPVLPGCCFYLLIKKGTML